MTRRRSRPTRDGDPSPRPIITVCAEYRSGVWIVRVNGLIVDTVAHLSEAAALANRLAGALGVTVAAPRDAGHTLSCNAGPAPG